MNSKHISIIKIVTFLNSVIAWPIKVLYYSLSPTAKGVIRMTDVSITKGIVK